MKPIKRSRISHEEFSAPGESSFDHLPNELILSILALLSSSANTPIDLAGVVMTLCAPKTNLF
jgi:hypothetical protein